MRVGKQRFPSALFSRYVDELSSTMLYDGHKTIMNCRFIALELVEGATKALK